MTGPMNFKEPVWRSKAYLEFVRSLPCCLTGRSWEPREAHHQNKKGHGGKSTKCGDERAIPITWYLHNQMETPGNSRAAMFRKWDKDPEELIRQTQEAWVRERGSRPWE